MELERVMAHLLVCLGAREGGQRGLVDGSRKQRRGLNGGEDAPVRGGRQEVAGWLRKVTAKLTEVSR